MFSLPEGIPPPKKQESLSPAPGNDIRWYQTTSGSSHPLLATAKVNPTLAGTKTSGLDLRGLGHDCRQNKRPRHAVSKMCMYYTQIALIPQASFKYSSDLLCRRTAFTWDVTDWAWEWPLYPTGSLPGSLLQSWGTLVSTLNYWLR